MYLSLQLFTIAVFFVIKHQRKELLVITADCVGVTRPAYIVASCNQCHLLKSETRMTTLCSFECFMCLDHIFQKKERKKVEMGETDRQTDRQTDNTTH